VINSPASEVAIKFNLQGFNTTISTGFTASLDALSYALDFLRLDRAKIVLAGGVEELCIQAYLGFYKSGLLAGQKGQEIACPFDKRRNGMILGEGAAILALETLSSALERKATIYAELKGYGRSLNSLKKAMQLALAEANLKTEDIDYINAAANSRPDLDLDEAQAIKDLFGVQGKQVLVSSIKSMVGECYSASGAFQALAAVGAIDKQRVPPTVNYTEKDPACDLNIPTKPADCRIENVLINAFAPGSTNSSLVVSKFRG
jgi:3-oxoacyl-[acyl-carrier-protein] synthase II